jgi:hypothetical protein
MSHHPTSYASPWPPPNTDVGGLTHSQGPSNALLHEAAQRDMEMVRAMNPPQFHSETPATQLPEPVLPDDFASRAVMLDRQIVEHGIAVDRKKLVSLGQDRFRQLLERDREARSEQRVFRTGHDFSRWSGVDFAFATIGALEATGIPARTNHEILSGAGVDREAVRTIDSFSDLWKSTTEPRSVRALFAFRDLFESLVFGRSLLEQIADDNRVHSKFFAGGYPSRKVSLFRSWLSTLRGPLLSVSVRQPHFALIAWLAGERTPVPSPTHLVHEFFSVRAPNKGQLLFCDALLQGFALGKSGWQLWEHVGRLTRKATDQVELEHRRSTLAKRFPAIERFHARVKRCFYRPVGDHLERDDKGHWLFLDEITHDCLQQLSLMVALTVEDALPDSLVARFESWFLCEAAKPPKALQQKIDEALKAAFPGSNFHVTVEEAARQ